VTELRNDEHREGRRIWTAGRQHRYWREMASQADIPGVDEPGMLTNDYTGTREALRLFMTEYCLGKVTEYGEQPIKRENAKRCAGSRIAE